MEAEKTELASPPGSALNPILSPDGKRLAFAIADFHFWTLHVINTLRGSPTNIVQRAYPGDWSPDGRLLVFTALISLAEYRAELRIFDLVTGAISVVPDSQ